MIKLLRSQSDSRLTVQVRSDLNETYVGQSGFYRLHFVWSARGQLLIDDGGIGEVCRPAAPARSAVGGGIGEVGRACAQCCGKSSKQAVSLSVHQDGGRRSTGISEILDTEISTAEI